MAKIDLLPAIEVYEDFLAYPGQTMAVLAKNHNMSISMVSTRITYFLAKKEEERAEIIRNKHFLKKPSSC